VDTVSVAVPPTATLALLDPLISTVAPGGPPDAVNVTLPNPAVPFTVIVYCAAPPGTVVCGGGVAIEKALLPLPTHIVLRGFREGNLMTAPPARALLASCPAPLRD